MTVAKESTLKEPPSKIIEPYQDGEYSRPWTQAKRALEVFDGEMGADQPNAVKSPDNVDFLCKARNGNGYNDAKPKADNNMTGQENSPPRQWRYKIGKSTNILLFPTTDLYRSYIADPRHPRFSIKMMYMTQRGIAETTRLRMSTSVGGSFGLFRIHADGRPDRGFQLQIGAGIFAQWDALMALDGIGWDGVYHILGTWTVGEQTALKLGINHMSSHIGDEYIENTGRKRIQYTREEIVAGISYILAKNWRAYVEPGYVYEAIKPPREHWRLQGGLEYESDPILFDGFAGWFVALDAKSYEENDWNWSTAAQVGIALPINSLGPTHRVGLEYYRGRSPMGEFFQEYENHLALGWWIEF